MTDWYNVNEKRHNYSSNCNCKNCYFIRTGGKVKPEFRKTGYIICFYSSNRSDSGEGFFMFSGSREPFETETEAIEEAKKLAVKHQDKTFFIAGLRSRLEIQQPVEVIPLRLS
jgi:hypothetical protein